MEVCSLEGDEDFLVSNRHPHCLTILNSSRHRHRHLRLLLEHLLAINLLRDSHNWTKHLLSMVGLTMTIALGARILVPSTFALTPPVKVTIINALHGQDLIMEQFWMTGHKIHLQVLLIMKGPVDTVSIPVPLQEGHLKAGEQGNTEGERLKVLATSQALNPSRFHFHYKSRRCPSHSRTCLSSPKSTEIVV